VFLGSAGVCLAVGRLAIRGLARARCLQPARHEDCPPLAPYQQGKEGTPTMGGLFLLAAAMLAAAAAGGLSTPEGWLILFAVAAMGTVGLIDDLLKLRNANAQGLRKMPKLVAAMLVGGWLGTQARSYRFVELPWLERSVDLGWGWVPLAMVVVAGCAHAVNLTDGLDGLATGCVAIALVALGALALRQPDGPVLPWCAGLAGACVGFLWFNGFPATVFLGDVGALGLGAALGAIALLTAAPLWLVIIGGVFVLEAISVVVQVGSFRLRQQRRVFRVAPLHHHFQAAGIVEPKLMIRFWILGTLFAALSFTALK